jgi:hypothetical protein
MLPFLLLSALCHANMAPPPDLSPPCTVVAWCSAEEAGRRCSHAPGEAACPELSDAGYVLRCTRSIPEPDGTLLSVLCLDPAAPPQRGPGRRCGGAGLAVLLLPVVIGLRSVRRL